MMRPEQSTDWAADLAARALAAACALNLNGVLIMTFDLGQGASVGMLITSLYLILKRGQVTWSAPLALLLLAIVSYLALASIFFDPLDTVYEPGKFYQAYIGAVLIIWAIAGYTAGLQPGAALGNFLRFLRNTFLLSAASVWASPILFQYYANLPLSAKQRMSGFFANPNEAAMAALLAIALTFGVPFRMRLLQVPFLLMAAGAVVLTFSKTAMSGLVIVLTWLLFQRVKGAMVFILPIVAFLTVAAIQNFDDVLMTIAENPVIELEQSQKDRILAVGKILGGELDEKTTTGRTFLWGLVLEKAWDHFPFGSGIGSAHNVVGGVVENDVWQGAHNTFIMMLGESGPLPAGLLVASMIGLFVAVKRNAVGQLELPCLFILLLDMMATHSALSTRYHNLMLAVVLGLTVNRGLVMASRAGRWPANAVPRGPFVGGGRTGSGGSALR
jgi:hypothetical protein